MPDSIVRQTIREIEPLRVSDAISVAARKVVDAKLPGLPAVDQRGKFAGIFGERELMHAIFPGYLGELSSSAMIKRSIDDAIERREGCWGERIEKYMTTDHVLVEDDYSDTQLAELFLHHRVLVIPVATRGKVHAVITRSDFFRALVARLGAASEAQED